MSQVTITGYYAGGWYVYYPLYCAIVSVNYSVNSIVINRYISNVSMTGNGRVFI